MIWTAENEPGECNFSASIPIGSTVQTQQSNDWHTLRTRLVMIHFWFGQLVEISSFGFLVRSSRYRALYTYAPQNDDELELQEGDMICVLEKCDDGWYVGTSQRTGLFGTFPGNYVERVWDLIQTRHDILESTCYTTHLWHTHDTYLNQHISSLFNICYGYIIVHHLSLISLNLIQQLRQRISYLNQIVDLHRLVDHIL